MFELVEITLASLTALLPGDVISMWATKRSLLAQIDGTESVKVWCVIIGVDPARGLTFMTITPIRDSAKIYVMEYSDITTSKGYEWMEWMGVIKVDDTR